MVGWRNSSLNDLEHLHDVLFLIYKDIIGRFKNIYNNNHMAFPLTRCENAQDVDSHRGSPAGI